MTLSFIRVFFIIISAVVGYYIGLMLQDPDLGWMIGALSALILIFLEMQMRRVSVRGLSSMVFGLLLGIVMAKLISDIMSLLPLGVFVHSVGRVVLTVVFAYLGAVMALRGKDEFHLIIPYVRFKRQDINESVILLDTSVVIDGRIQEVFRANFIAGTLLVPRFVLQELQQLADSADDLKRQKGRRGLDILKNMRQDAKININIHEDDLTGKQSVDSKLVTLAKLMDAKICTTDANLGRVASLQNIIVLNLNELANALKPALISGEALDIGLIKQGKEEGQAIGYLEDGTMIVVSDAKNLIGDRVKIVVTSILQTQSGKMIFAKLDN